MSTTAEFPARTAGEVTLPDGAVAWVQTLNSLLREQVESKSRRYAANECRGLLKGGVDYPAAVAWARTLPTDQQVTYLAQQEFWGIQQEANGTYPEPPEPEQGELDPEGYGKAIEKWNEEKKKADGKRQEFIEKRYEAQIKRFAALTVKVREERCLSAYYNNEFVNAYILRQKIETIYRAARRNDDHTQRFFASAEEYEDADDGVQKALHDFYFETLAIPASEAVPILPAAS